MENNVKNQEVKNQTGKNKEVKAIELVTFKGSLSVNEGYVKSEDVFTAGKDWYFNGKQVQSNLDLSKLGLQTEKSKTAIFNVLLVNDVNYIKTISFKSKSGKDYYLTLLNKYEFTKVVNSRSLVERDDYKKVKGSKEAGFIYSIDEKTGNKKMVASYLSANSIINQLLLMTGKTYQSCDSIYKQATINRSRYTKATTSFLTVEGGENLW